MKKIGLLALIILSFFSCKKDNGAPFVETVTKGDKWGLSIGSSFTDVYTRLQVLGQEKNFHSLLLNSQPPILKPEDLQNRLELYSGLSFQIKNPGRIEQVILYFSRDTIQSIEAGGGLPVETTQWPQDVSGQPVLKKGDPVNGLYNKLLAIFQLPAYANNYQFFLNAKPLDKPWDPAMAKCEEWDFDFSVTVRPGREGRSSVNLFFKDGQLYKIVHSYSEGDVYN
jgi:hypothetical protein